MENHKKDPSMSFQEKSIPVHPPSKKLSLLSLLLNFEPHQNALMRVLNETYVAHDIFVLKMDHLVGNIAADN